MQKKKSEIEKTLDVNILLSIWCKEGIQEITATNSRGVSMKIVSITICCSTEQEPHVV